MVNRRKTAQELFAQLPQEGSYCLTTLLCAADRRRQLDEIRQRLHDGLPCRVVSTSLIEAGVDVDFPLAYREAAGLDSLQPGGPPAGGGKPCLLFFTGGLPTAADDRTERQCVAVCCPTL